MKRLNKLFFLIIIALSISCSEDEFENIQEVQLEKTEVVQKLLDMGFDIEDIRDNGDKYVVEGDMLFSKDINDFSKFMNHGHKNLNTSRQNGSSINLYNFSSLISPDNYCIYVYSELSGGPVISENPDWSTAVDDALNLWSQATCIELRRTYVASEADIRIKDDPTMPGSKVGWGLHPSNGNPGATVWMNEDFEYNSYSERVAGLSHEIGHTLGFEHTFSENSVMNYAAEIFLLLGGPTPSDISALNAQYDDCNPNGPCDTGTGPGTDPQLGTINGPSNPCTETIVAYNWSEDSTSVDSWLVSSNLTILSEDANSVEVYIQGGQTATIDAVIGGSIEDTFNININSGPSPTSNFTIINGPSDLNRGTANARYYYVSSSTLSGVSDINWTVFSYDYPNASQYFSITSPSSGNSEYNATISAASNTPPGQYVIQFQTSNECGNYYIDKNIEVIGGPPVIVGF